MPWEGGEDFAVITLCGFGVSPYYNKLKLLLLEKDIPFRERLVYPWERDTFRPSSPLGKIPFVETDHGALSESQVILEYLEERFPERPMYPSDPFARAKCRELIQHLELNAEWVARRLFKESLFGGQRIGRDETRSPRKTSHGTGSGGATLPFLPLHFRTGLYRGRLCRLHALHVHQDHDVEDLWRKHAGAILPGPGANTCS